MGEPPWHRYRKEDTSRGRAACSSFIAASMVGTATVWVTPSRSIRSRATAGSNAGSTTLRPVFHTVASTAIDPAAWNRGAMISQRVAGVKGQMAMKWNVLATRFRWVSITPFAAPVVPPV